MRSTPATMARLQRAAAEIEGQARSRARHPSHMARMISGAPLNWPFNGHDLMRVLERCGLAVIELGRYTTEGGSRDERLRTTD